MTVRAHSDLTEFWGLARRVYEADPARHNVSLEVVRGFLDSGGSPDRMLTIWRSGVLVGAAFSSEGRRPLLFSAVPERSVAEVAARAWLAAALHDTNRVFLIWEDRGAPVYVPKELRGSGYGIAVAGAATAWALAEGGAERVVLFTDLANPVSNSIYAKLGYRPVEEFAKITFDS